MAQPEVYADQARLGKRRWRRMAAPRPSSSAWTATAMRAGRARCCTASGFAEADFDLPVSALSGGQRKLVGLARLLAIQSRPAAAGRAG